MIPDAITLDRHIKLNRVRIVAGLSLLVLLIVVIVEAAYVKGRPITQTGGQIDQGYLWGGVTVDNNNNIVQHKGVDFPYTTGTDVYAVARGRVVDLNEDYPNGGNQGTYGNYVLLRHLQRHYDRNSGQWAYVYSLYFHLSQGSVQPSLNQLVDSGDWIADVDNSGVSTTGPHLHLQIVINTRSDGDLEPIDNLNITNNARNPELWLTSYQGNTARMAGKVTDINGNPIGNLIICGVVKPYGGFDWVRTYSYSWMKPDDILLENFATTDVSPGTYNVHAYTYVNNNSNCAGTPYRNLGTYTFQANKTTYIGLYPMYLPMLHENSTRNSIITTRNNSTSYRTKTETTFVRDTGLVSTNYDRTDDLAPRAHGVFSPPSLSLPGSARVVGSQDEAVGAQIEYCSGSYCAPAGYSGITAELGVGTRGWEKTGTTIYVPLVKNKFNSRSSEIYITNVGTDTAEFTVTYYAQNGTSYNGGNHLWQLDQTGFLTANGRAPEGTYYSARIVSTNGQPLAVVVLEGDGYPPASRPAMYNGFSAGHTTLYAPVIKNEFPNTGTPSESTSGITVQNTTGSTATVTAQYYNDAGGLVETVSNIVIPPYSPYVLYPDPGNPAAPSLPLNFSGSARISSDRNIVGQVSESNGHIGGGRRMMSNLALGDATSRTAVFPLWYNHHTVGGRGWVCGVNVRHAGSSGQTTVTARWYNGSGGYVCELLKTLLNPNDIETFYNESCPVSQGSLVLESSSQNIVAVASCADSAHNNFVNDIVLTMNGSNR